MGHVRDLLNIWAVFAPSQTVSPSRPSLSTSLIPVREEAFADVLRRN